jgi:hypothetical protein
MTYEILPFPRNREVIVDEVDVAYPIEPQPGAAPSLTSSGLPTGNRSRRSAMRSARSKQISNRQGPARAGRPGAAPAPFLTPVVYACDETQPALG